MTITTIYPDGTTETREPTTEELAQAALDEQTMLDHAWHELRNKRNQLLSASDWTVLSDSPTPTAAWKTYRQALRDLPANTTDPFNVVWPTPPA
jgi:hypothetical protein